MEDIVEQTELSRIRLISKLLTDLILEQKEIISLLKEKIERLENENIVLQQNKRSK